MLICTPTLFFFLSFLFFSFFPFFSRACQELTVAGRVILKKEDGSFEARIVKVSVNVL